MTPPPNPPLSAGRKEPIIAVYERFKHMDKLFCDPLIRQEGADDVNPYMVSMFAMWDAIKEYAERTRHDTE